MRPQSGGEVESRAADYRGDTSARRQQRTNGVPQHQSPVDRSARVWIPLRSGADSPLRAHTRRPMPTAPRPTTVLNEPTEMPQDPFYIGMYRRDVAVVFHRRRSSYIKLLKRQG